MPERASHLTLVLAILAAVLAGMGSTAQVDDSPIAPSYQDPTAEELAFYDQAFPCPPIFDWESIERTVDVDSNVSIRCGYRTAEGRNQSLTVRWMKSDNPWYATGFCAQEPERQDDGSGRITNRFYDTTDHAISGEYSLNQAADAEAVLQAAAEAMMADAADFARACAEPPTQLDCPQVPGFVIGTFGPGEADDIQPDTYAQTCSYESTDPDLDARLRIEVWWAARGGIPELFDRLCNEFPMEGVGFGSLIADGVAANGTYTISSPMVGPDRAVAVAAAQALLDQGAAIARSCDEAEVNPTTFQPFPQYLAPAFTPELTAVPPTGGGMASLPGGGGSGSSGGAAGTDAGFIQTLIRIGSIVMLALSILGLFITFLLVRRETRIQEKRDLLRIGITLGVAVFSALIIGRDAPLWAILVAIGLGIALGTWQGSGLIVRRTERGLVGKRRMIAIVAFGAGVLLMQTAGLLNRSGGVTLGIAVSFLSAAITAGLFLGRKPRMVEALGGTARVLLPLLVVAGLLGGFGVAAGNAQTDPGAPPSGTCTQGGGFGFLDLEGCEGYEHLLDLVPWDEAFVSGGLWWGDGKPPAPISLPRGTTTPPEPVTQTVTWATTDSSDNPIAYEVTETYSFGTLAEGQCCSAFYEATGTKTTTRISDNEVTVDVTEVAGRLEDIQPFGTIGLGGEPMGIPFSEVLTLNGFPEDSCQRAVAWRQEDNEEGAATWDSIRVNGEETGFASTQVTVFIECDLSGFTYENAFSLAPPVPGPDDPVRQLGGLVDGNPRICPVRQEFARSVWNAGRFDGIDTLTLAELYLEPNAPACDYGSLFSPVSFGQGGRGNTRHEVTYRLAFLNDPAAEAARLADDADTFYTQSRLTSILEHERCELGADGVPLQPADGSACRYVSIHSVDQSGLSNFQQTGRTLQTRNISGGVVYIETDWDTKDGPNVTVRAHLPWGKFIYRCHHCTPGSKEIGDFVRSLSGFGVSRGRFDPAFAEGEPPATTDSTAATTEAIGTEVDPGSTEETELAPVGEEEEGISIEEAGLIGLVGLVGSIGLLGASLPGTGLSPAEVAAAVRRGDLTGGVGDLPPEDDGAPSGEEPLEEEPAAEEALAPAAPPEEAPAPPPVPPETPAESKAERMRRIRRQAAEHRTRRIRPEFEREEQRIAEQEQAAALDTVSWTNVSRSVYDAVERVMTVNMPVAVRDALSAYNPNNPLRTNQLAAAVSSSLGDKADDFYRGIKQAIRALPHPAANSMAALTNAGDQLDMWARSWAPHVRGARASAGRLLSGAGAALDFGRALDRGAQIIQDQGLQGEGLVAQAGAYALGGVHVAMHTVITKNPLVLAADVALGLGTGGRVSVDAALTELEDGFFRTTGIAASTAGEFFADAPVARGAAMQRDRVIDAIRRTSARTDLSQAQKDAKLSRLRGLLGSS